MLTQEIAWTPLNCTSCGVVLPVGGTHCERCYTKAYNEALNGPDPRIATIEAENARLRAAWDGLAAALPEWDREKEGAQHAVERLRCTAANEHDAAQSLRESHELFLRELGLTVDKFDEAVVVTIRNMRSDLAEAVALLRVSEFTDEATVGHNIDCDDYHERINALLARCAKAVAK